MIATTLHELAAAVDGELLLADADPDAGGGPDGGPVDGALTLDTVVTDSRALADASAPAGGSTPLFVALPGEHADGHDFVAAAVAAGARAVLVEHAVEGLGVPAVVVGDTWQALRALAGDVRRRVDPATVAITGSLGKTTVKDLTAAAAGAGRQVHASHGSFNNELGVPLTLLGLQAHHEVLVTEIGARRPGDIRPLTLLVAPDVAVITAIQPVHLEIFGTIDAIARTKAELLDGLGPSGTAILHTADPRVAALRDRAPHVLGVAIDDPQADVHATDVRVDGRARPSATAVTPWGRTTLTLPVAGRHQLLNGLLALAVAGHLGVDLDAAAAAIATAPVSRWRGEVVELDGVVVLDDAYNANPAATAAALETLVAVERTGASIAVLGEMAEIGPTSADEHRAIGRRCVQLGVDRVVVVGPGAAPIAQGAREAGHSEVTEVPDVLDAARLLHGGLGAGDVVLVKASRAAGLDVVTGELRRLRDAHGVPVKARR